MVQGFQRLLLLDVFYRLELNLNLLFQHFNLQRFEMSPESCVKYMSDSGFEFAIVKPQDFLLIAYFFLSRLTTILVFHSISNCMRTLFIVNPVSAGGRTALRFEKSHTAIRNVTGDFSISYTEYQGHGIELARQAFHEGVERVIAVGGDGTLNEIVNGYFENGSPINPNATISISPTGTGGDFRRNFGMRSNDMSQVDFFDFDNPVMVDCGIATFRHRDGGSHQRYFINVASIGVSEMVATRINNAKYIKKLGGPPAFLITALTSMLSYKGVEAVIKTANDTIEVNKLDLIAIANGKWFGGAMKIAPNAIINDGLFDVILIHDFSTIGMIINNAKVYSGNHTKHKNVKVMRTDYIEVDTNPGLKVDTDGELPGSTPVEFRIKPLSVPFVVPRFID